MAARTTIPEPTETWTETLNVSRDRVLAAAQARRHGAAVLAHATAGRMVAAWTLDPAAVDPVTHLEQTHARGQRHLRRLLDQPHGAEVQSPMTNQLFDRLTQPGHPTKRKRIEEPFGWMKTVGVMRKTRHRGCKLVEWSFVLTAAAYNLTRIRKILAVAG